MSIIEVKNLSHSYNGGREWAVKDVSFNISSRGVVGLLGSNGAGKSTTMNIICGVINQTKGDVSINGLSLKTDARQAKQNLGFLPQEPPLYPDLTVDEYLFHCARLRRMSHSQIPNAVESVKEKVHISHFSNRLIKNLSGGYRQRVGIAQAIIHQPRLVVLDEPTVGLDPNQIVELRQLISEIAKDTAVLLSTHIMSEVEMICRSVVMIEGGRVIFNGSLDEFREMETIQSLIITFEENIEYNQLVSVIGVEQIESIGNSTWKIHFLPNISIHRNIVAKSMQEGWNIKEMYFEQPTLDAVFAKLSKNGLKELPVS